MVQTMVKYSGYGYIEEAANDLLKRMDKSERFIDIKVYPLSDIIAAVMLIYESEV